MAEKEKVNVKVVVRCRPPSENERCTRQLVTAHESSNEVVVVQHVAGKPVHRVYNSYNQVFGEFAAQQDVFASVGKSMVDEVLKGFNGTIFAYGQTGTGKTYTMEGNGWDNLPGQTASQVLPVEAGLIPRCVQAIFSHLQSLPDENYTVKCSFMEIYNEELVDLLSPGKAQAELRIMEEPGTGRLMVRGLREEFVETPGQALRLLARGIAARSTAETRLNAASSRSHSIFTLCTHIKEEATGGDDLIKLGKLNLVDLAGSENVSRSGARDMRAREAGSINQSLLTLGRVINALVEGGQHVPYRDSKLTRLLQDSLGGTTKTCIVATVAPTLSALEESVNTLDYALRARSVKNRPQINARISQKAMIRELTRENERLKAALGATHRQHGIFVTPEQYEEYEEQRVACMDAMHTLQEQEHRTRRLLAALDEHVHLVDAYQGSEAALAQHASALQQQLAAVDADRAVMHASLLEARETVRKREAETAGRWGMLSDAAAKHFESAGDTLEQLSAATSALVALKQAQEACVAGWGTAAEAAARGLREHGDAAQQAAPDGEALAQAREDAVAALQAATEPVVEALEGVLQRQEALQKDLMEQQGRAQALQAEHSKLLEVVAALAEKAPESTAAAGGAVKRAAGQVSALRGAAADRMGALAASLTCMLEEGSAAVVRAVQDTLQAAVQEQCAAVRTAADAAAADTVAAAAGAEAACDEAAAAVRKGGAEVEDGLAKVQTAEQGMARGLGVSAAGLQRAVRGCGETGAATATLEEGLQSMGDAVAAAVENLMDDAEAQTAAVAAALEGVASGARTAADDADVRSEAVRREWSGLRSEHDVLLNDVLHAADGGEAEAAQSSRAISQTLQEQSASNAAFRLPAVPQPLQVERFPEGHAQALRAPPRDVMLAVFRSNQPAASHDLEGPPSTAGSMRIPTDPRPPSSSASGHIDTVASNVSSFMTTEVAAPPDLSLPFPAMHSVQSQSSDSTVAALPSARTTASEACSITRAASSRLGTPRSRATTPRGAPTPPKTDRSSRAEEAAAKAASSFGTALKPLVTPLLGRNGVGLERHAVQSVPTASRSGTLAFARSKGRSSAGVAAAVSHRLVSPRTVQSRATTGVSGAKSSIPSPMNSHTPRTHTPRTHTPRTRGL